MPLSPKVTDCIGRYFPDAERKEVAELLAAYGAGVSEQAAERIHLLILTMSRRQVGRVRSLVQAAKHDYRDVILWATRPTRTYVIGLLRLAGGVTVSRGQAERRNTFIESVSLTSSASRRCRGKV